MKNMMEYRGYFGSVNYDAESELLYGKLEFIKALVDYQAADTVSLKIVFREAVDDYLEMCKDEGIKPEKPLKGSFQVRSTAEIHKAIMSEVQKNNTTLNAFVNDALKAYLAKKGVRL